METRLRAEVAETRVDDIHMTLGTWPTSSPGMGKEAADRLDALLV